MCWFIDVVVVPQKATTAGRITSPELPEPVGLHGAHLDFSLASGGHCACDIAGEVLATAVDGFCGQPEVKRVEVRRYWAGRESPEPREIAMSQSDFRELCSASGCEEDVRYRVSPDRFRRDAPG